ncbi:MAG: glycosyltransferase family 39 protein, partial [Candidatus Hydrogenedentes bacterium]|nr:glycosyltransferase family 39 protein [Candidatus Hydrogenedentota bacterium]
IIAVLGHTHTAIHLALLLMNGLNTVFVFLLGRRLAGEAVGLTAATFFATLSLGVHTEGFSANSEQFVILFASAGLCLLLRGLDRRERPTIAAAGACLAMAFLMKQHGATFLLFGGVYLCAAEWGSLPRDAKASVIRIGSFAAGAVGCLALALTHIVATGRTGDFYFWTWGYASQYASATPLSQGWAILSAQLPRVVTPMIVIWALAVGGLYSAGKVRERRLLWFLFGLLVFSFLAASIGFYYRPHYFRLLFPAVSLLAGVGACAMARAFASGPRAVAVVILVVALAVGYSLFHERAILFQSTPAEASRETGGANPSSESLPVAEYIADHTEPGDAIAVFGSEPQIYFYAHRPAATGHIYTYQLMEDHPFALKMQQQFIEEVEQAEPKYVVWVNTNIFASWLIRESSHPLLFQWSARFLRDDYEQVGFVDIVSPIKTNYRWGESANDLQSISSSGYFLTIHRRKEATHQSAVP